MEFFLDTADVDEIREIAAWGILDGVTTNPSLIKKSGRDFKEVVREIAGICSGPISAEVTAMDTQGMLEQARQLKSELPENVIIKIPCTPEGLAATKVLTGEGVDTNVTLIFSASQALMAAKAGATYVSPFIGRIDDTGHDGMNLIAEIMETWEKYDISTKVLAASIRHPTHVLQCMQLGAHTATMPAKIFRQLMKHPLTDKGLEGFMRDWAEVEAAGKA
ncbi:MAG: fructose-6-phosphate aldolase [Rhodobiaceae bacterium]|mgnify:FL=1|nr:fructose-6-phosphate aldolase [Rhodobiaceae bacterium]|tara:strand:- start:226 stop:885 length:660 start_codon:yes stop_codon:yes gene_type:complete